MCAVYAMRAKSLPPTTDMLVGETEAASNVRIGTNHSLNMYTCTPRFFLSCSAIKYGDVPGSYWQLAGSRRKRRTWNVYRLRHVRLMTFLAVN